MVKFAVSETSDFVLVHKARMNQTNSGNQRVDSVTPFILLILSVDILMSSVTITLNKVSVELMFLRPRDLASCIMVPIV